MCIAISVAELVSVYPVFTSSKTSKHRHPEECISLLKYFTSPPSLTSFLNAT